MAWIEFHAARLKRLQKFRDFRIAMGWSVNETLGFLGNLWGEVIELREDGDLTGWTPDYVAELAAIKPDLAGKVWETLVSHLWIEQRDGLILVHDWPDFAGTYLRSRYKTRKRDRLVEIWRKHGRTYGDESSQVDAGSPREALGSPAGDTSRAVYRTVPDRTGPDLTKPTVPDRNVRSVDVDAIEQQQLLRLVWKIRGEHQGHRIQDLPVEYCEWALDGGLSALGAEYRKALSVRIAQKRDEAAGPRRGMRRLGEAG